MAKFITFNGITYVHPGAVSKVDVSALAQVSASATGIVALVGEAEGGQPNMVTAAGDPNNGVPKVYTFFDPSLAKSTFRNGPLADAIALAFDAANDPRIAGGSSQVLAIKTNQSTSSDATLHAQFAPADDSCEVRSKDYGVHTANIQIELDVSAADTQNNETVVTIKDNSTGVTETHNAVAGQSLIDVQYRGPDAGNVIFTGTTTASSGNNKLDDTGTTFNPGGSASAAIGNWIRITSVPSAVAADRELVGQVRRVSGVAANILDVIEPWIDDASPGAARTLPTGTGYEVVREVIGPFLAVDGTTGNSTLSTTAVDDDTVTFHASNKAGTVGLYSVDNSATSASFNSTGVFMLGVANGAADAAKYADVAEGPNYIKIVSGPGAGQIRPILAVTGTDAVGPTQTMIVQIEALDGKGWSPKPTAASRFSFVNLSKGDAATGANGALMTVTGGTGAATQLLCQLKPGLGEWNGVGTVTTTLANANHTDITLTISATDTAADIINQLNSPASPLVSLSKQGWFARMGSGRVSTELASDLDWDGVVNTAVFACVGFDQIFSNTWGITSSSAPVTAVKKARLMDNLKQLIDTINAQSSLVSLKKLTTAATDGKGMPELNTPATPLTGGAAGVTSTTDLANAYDVLIRHRCNTVVPLWSKDDTAISLAEVHAATLSHTNLASGAAKNECDAILAIDVTSSANPLNDLLDSQADLNNRNCALVYQGVQRTNVDSKLTKFEPHMQAVILAGMQAGTPIGEPLTFKYMRTNDLIFPNALDPKDTTASNQMLLSGILFAEEVKGKGFRVVRNLSTFTQTDNLAFTDRNVNEVLNYVSYDLRSFIEDRFTGLKATPATATSIKDSVISKLSSYRDADIIVDSTNTVTGQRINAFRNVRVSISGDIATIRFEMFPVIGINFETIEIFAQLPTISA